MRTKALFTQKQPQYRYFRVNPIRADIFIYNYIRDVLDEETGATLYEHELNQFTINPSDITEDMIKKNPMNYMDYIAPVEKTDAEKLADAENSITELQMALCDLYESVGDTNA